MELTKDKSALEFDEDTLRKRSMARERNLAERDRKLEKQLQIHDKHISISHRYPEASSVRDPNKNSLYSDLQDSDELRLLYLQPGSPNEMIKCTMKHVKFSEKPAFEALSYVWGPEGVVQPIVINECTIYIRQNLWTAMQHLRSDTETRVLWIDATCIDQQNIHERNHQVTQMGKIYNQATRVIVWLGLSDANSKLALEILSSPSKWVDFMTIPSDLGKRLERDSKLKALSTIFDRDYWTRLWIIQEFVLARDFILMCGRNVCSGFRFSWFLDLLESLNGISRTPTRANEATIDLINDSIAARLCRLRKRGSWQEQSRQERNFTKARSGYVPQSLFGMFSQYNASKCVDQRDRIFGLHSLAMACCKNSIPIDYSLTWDVIFEKLVRHQFIFHDKYKRRPITSDTKVMDIRKLLLKPISLFNIFRLHTNFSLNQPEGLSQLSTDYDWERPGDVFELISYVRGRICYISPIISQLDPSKDYLDIPELTPMIKLQLNYLCSLNENRNSRHPYATTETDILALDIEFSVSIFDLSAVESLIKRYTHYWACNLHENNDDGDGISNLEINLRQLFYNAKNSFPRAEFVLAFEENGLVFLASKKTKIGDLLCQFPGSDVLAVIPKINSGVTDSRCPYAIGNAQRAVNFLASPHNIATDICGKSMSFAKAKPYAIEFEVNPRAMEQLCRFSQTPNGPHNILEISEMTNRKRKRPTSSEVGLTVPVNKLAAGDRKRF